MKCKICEESFDAKYRIPRNLICGHCFCEQCLKIYLKNQEIECPRCLKKSPSKVPISYAIFELLDGEENKRTDHCSIHSFEKIQFICKDDNVQICVKCLITSHNGHVISSIKEEMIANQIKKDFEKLHDSALEKQKFLLNLREEIEKCEDFINKINNQQRTKLNEIQTIFVSKKKDKIEEFNKIIELNYLNQYELLNKLILETEHKKNFIDIYSAKIQELLHSFQEQNTSDVAKFNITKTEDEFRKVRMELENNLITKISDVKVSELYLDFNPRKMISEEYIKYDVCSNINLNFRKEKFNHVIFFGDSKDKLIILYDFKNDCWSVLECESYEQTWELLDYSSAATYSNNDILLTGGCYFTNFRNTATKAAYLIKLASNIITVSAFKPLLIDRFSHGSLIIKDVPYVFGGHDGNETLASMEYYDTNESKWKFLSFMTIEREIFAYCCVKQRYIYVFGGFNVNHLDSIERYDIVYDKWKILDIKMKRPLQNATAVDLDNNKIVLIGGYNGALHKCVDILDLVTKMWTSLEYMQVPRRKSHSYNYQNSIFIFGGESSESEVHIPEVYHIKSNTWTQLKSYDNIVARSLNFWCSTGIYI